MKTRRRILLVEDEESLRRLLLMKLTEDIVYVARNGIEALDVLRRIGGMVDILITDVRMPRMGGIELAQAVRRILPDLPVLFISGWSDDLRNEEWQRPGYGLLLKPFSLKAFSEKVARLLDPSEKSPPG
jgi:two-component system, cell cycle sensor histidine kinase and response regulator CckA